MAQNDYYDQGDDSGNDQPEPDMPEKDNSDSTALLPKSFFQGKAPEVGHECKVEVVHVYEDEVEVKYLPEGKDEEKSEPAPEMAAETGNESGSQDQNYQ